MRRLTLTLAAAALLVSACTLAPGEEVKSEAIETTTTSTSLAEVTTTTTTAPVATTTTAVCHEDMPCWDCETMGNGICGEATSCAEASA